MTEIPAHQQLFYTLQGKQVSLPAGATVIERSSVYALIVAPDSRVLMVQAPWLPETYILPGGGVEDCDKTLWDTAVRETMEETGMPIRLIDPDPVQLPRDFFCHGEKYYDCKHMYALLAAPKNWGLREQHPTIPESARQEVCLIAWVDLAALDIGQVHRIYRPLISSLKMQHLKTLDESCNGSVLTDAGRRRPRQEARHT